MKSKSASHFTFNDVSRLVGVIPKFPVYTAWLRTFANKVQSICSSSMPSTDKSSRLSSLDPHLTALVTRFIDFAVTCKPLQFPLYVSSSDPISIYTDASKYCMGYIITQFDKVVASENYLFPSRHIPLNISFKEMMCIRFALSAISKLQCITRKTYSVNLFSDSALRVSIIKNGRIHGISQANRNHSELIRREFSIIQELLCNIQPFHIFHVKGEFNPADALTRCDFLSYLVSNFYGDVLDETNEAKSPRAINSTTSTSDTASSATTSSPVLFIDGLPPNFGTPINFNDILNAQKADSSLPALDGCNFTLINGLVYKKNNKGQPSIYIPLSLRPKVLALFHDTLCGVHANSQRMMDSLRKLYYWKGMQEDVNYWVNSCAVCQQYRRSTPNTAKLYSLQAHYPLEVISMDYLYVDGRWLLTVQDIFSKFLTSFVLPVGQSPSASTTITSLLDYFSAYGVPKRVYCDNGSHFKNHKVVDFLSRFNCTMFHSPPYHPASHGGIEKANSTILGLIRKSGVGQDWSAYLPLLVLSYNCQKNDTTGFPPYTLFFGREAPSPLSLPSTGPTTATSSYNEYYDAISDGIRSTSATASQHTLQAVSRRQAYRKVNDVNIPTNGYVWYYNPVRSSKPSPKWLGPFRCTGVSIQSPSLVTLIDSNGKSFVVHRNQIRPVTTTLRLPPVTTSSTTSASTTPASDLAPASYQASRTRVDFHTPCTHFTEEVDDDVAPGPLLGHQNEGEAIIPPAPVTPAYADNDDIPPAPVTPADEGDLAHAGIDAADYHNALSDNSDAISAHENVSHHTSTDDDDDNDDNQSVISEHSVDSDIRFSRVSGRRIRIPARYC